MKAEVRRLTEKECCRLQGIPDDHPFIHGEDTSGSSVYQCQGNGWARNCSRLVFKNIHVVDGSHNGGVRPFKIGSVSSGQGTHELSVQDFGDESVFCSEIAPFPCEVLSERFGMPNLGDVTRIHYDPKRCVIHNKKPEGYELMSEAQLGFKPVDADDAEILIKYGELDCISGGLPCFTIGGEVMGKRFVCVLDMGGGKPGGHWTHEQVSPTLTRGRASINDIHLVCFVRRKCVDEQQAHDNK